ncbi:MAG: Unknown protein [uncultured Thiotrichaceae bacterium]|uniref:TolC family protein n=1 Tax=uncultured Thiotrichaceae bacterium TaxID=298394 RepID=A0A6S6SL06_9GAMM|nr:MAG: Unknown protein [uncultured Thiotrichaceae bacterium]
MSKGLSKISKVLSGITVCALCSYPVQANDGLPNPLTLSQALDYAPQHPRLKLESNEQHFAFDIPPLYLNCHAIAANQLEHPAQQPDNILSPLIAPEVQQQLIILQRFYDVLLADLTFIATNEKMASAFIRVDRAKIRNELKQISEVEVARLETEYQNIRQEYFATENMQRLTRSWLSESINQLKLPSDLQPPTLVRFPRQAPDYQALLNDTKQNTYLNDLSKKSSKAAKAQLNSRLRQEILGLLLRGQMLRFAKQAIDADSYQRDLNLERSRTLYEQEVKADLGNSMVMQSFTNMYEKRIDYCLSLTWAQINALRGKPLFTKPEPKKPEE